MTEELYQRLRVGISNFQFQISNQSNNSTMKQSNNFTSIHLQSWPEYEEKYLVEDQVQIVVQVNGKMRDVVSIPYTVYSIQKEVEKRALASEKVQKYLKGTAKKTIYVEGRIINFVID